MRGGLALAVLVTGMLVLPEARAHAGRTRFGWITDTETLPQRGAELESWLIEQDGKGDPKADQTLLIWAPVVGLTDRIELALPVEVAFNRNDTTSSQLLRFGGELRIRLVDADPVEAGPFAALVRVAVKRPTNRGSLGRYEGELVLSYDAGPVHLGATGAVVFDVNDDSNATTALVRPGAGVSVAAVGELRFGAEIFAELQLRSGISWVAAGPDIAFSYGRSWFSGAFLIGIDHIDFAPRILWAIAF